MQKAMIMMLFIITSGLDVQVKAASNEAVIIEVRKNLPLSKQEKTYRNYFINGGTQLGLYKGAKVDIMRRLPVHDPLKSAAIGDLRVKVGQLEIMQADPKLSIGRLIHMETPEERPLLDYEAVMIGDRLDLGSIKSNSQSKEIALLDKKMSAQELIAEGKRHMASLESVAPAKGSAPANMTKLAAAKSKKVKSPGRTIKSGKVAASAQKKQATNRMPASTSPVSKK